MTVFVVIEFKMLTKHFPLRRSICIYNSLQPLATAYNVTDLSLEMESN